MVVLLTNTCYNRLHGTTSIKEHTIVIFWTKATKICGYKDYLVKLSHLRKKRDRNHKVVIDFYFLGENKSMVEHSDCVEWWEKDIPIWRWAWEKEEGTIKEALW